MAEYLHGIDTKRDADISVDAVQATRVMVAVGTAPINLLNDPQSAVNKPVLVNTRKEVQEKLGVSTDYEHYTLMQVMLAALQKVGVAPVVMINVLDPSKPAHITAVGGEDFDLTKGSLKVEVAGILMNTVVVTNSTGTKGVADVDYVATFDENGYLSIAVTKDGQFYAESKLTVAYTKLNPAGVTAADIIGGATEYGVRTGIELVDEVYSRFALIPDILCAPGYSKEATVAAALEAKAELTGDLTNAIALVDMESEATTKLDDIKEAKNKLGCFSRWTVLCWPKVIVAGHEIYASSVIAAMLQRTAFENGNVPTSPDNKTVPIDGVVLESGQELHLSKTQVNEYLNANGVVSFAYLGGWKCWGNNTAAYPDNTDPNNRFIKCVMVGNYLENRFKTEYLSAVGADGKYKTIESIVSNYNADLNALTQDYLAGAEVIFNKDENPISQILEGHFYFHTRYADWTPMEYIENDFTWDSKILENAFAGGNE